MALSRLCSAQFKSQMVRGYSLAAATSRPLLQLPAISPSQRDYSSEKLPKLPVPNGEKTLERFIDFASALESSKELQKTKEIVSRFANEEMPKLQSLLEERAKKHNNWLTPWWLNIAYLEARTPLPVVTSPGVLFPKLNYSGQEGQIDAGAKITQAALIFFEKIRNAQLTQDKAGSAPLDMSQYDLLFGTTRVPKVGKDEIRYGRDLKVPAKHIIVARNGHLFKVDVLDSAGRYISLDLLKKRFQEVVAAAAERNANPVSILSSLKRDRWAKLYESLQASNAAHLTTIENGLFLVSLDGPSLPPKGYSEKDEQARQALHGGGSGTNSINRWFDKTLQFVIGEEGYCGMTYEHTPAEGPPVAALMDFVMDQFQQRTFTESGSPDSASGPVVRIDFSLNAEQRREIERAKQKMDKVSQNLEVVTYSFTRFGKNFPKSAKMSPDSFIQLAFQVAYYRIHGVVPPTYETASLRKFDEGRTENIRLPNSQTAKFCLMMNDKFRPFSELYEQLQAAITSHKNYTLDCMNGSGMDRHLLAWGLLASEAGLPTPSILDTEVYKKMKHFQVSTSQVPTRHFIQMCFGPSEDDCYGICYNPQEKEFHFTITTFKHFPSTSSKRFAKELEKALNDLRAICAKGQKEKAKL